MSTAGLMHTMNGWRRLPRRLGVPGLMAMGLGLAVAWGWFVWLPPLQAELGAAQDRVTTLRQQLLAGIDEPRSAPLGKAPQNVEAPWQRLWFSLPEAHEAPRLQGRLLEAAAAQGVTLQAVQYRGAASRNLPGLWRQQVSLPVEAPYPAVRAWLGWILQQPAMSVDALDLSRADPMGEQVKARLEVSIWWRTERSAAASRAP